MFPIKIAVMFQHGLLHGFTIHAQPPEIVMPIPLDMPDAELTRAAEVTIRNHDPCISCATHFLDLTIDRDGTIS